MDNKITNIGMHHKDAFAFLCSYIIFCLFLTNYISIFTSQSFVQFSAVTPICELSIGVLFIFYFFQHRLYDYRIFVFLLTSLLVVFLNALLFPNLNEFFIKNAFKFFSLCSLSFISVLMIVDYDVFFRFSNAYL